MDDLTQREFLAEIEELVEQLFAVTEDLRRPETQGPLQRELLARTFRCLHSLKGIASSAGLTGVAELAHQTEGVLDGARSGRIEVDIAFVDTLEGVANNISETLSKVTSGNPEPVTEILVQRLSTLAAGAAGAAGAPALVHLPNLPADLVDSLNEREKELLLGALRQKARLFLVATNFDMAVFDTEFQKLRETLAQCGEVICTLPSAEGPAANRISFRLFYTSEFALSEVQARLAAFANTIVSELALPSLAVEGVMQRALRAGRVAAGMAGKEVEFSVSGSDLQIDKAICDMISTPLLHLIRNAVDHGIESPEERTKAGKNQSGAVRIVASASDGEVRFVVSDDGRGIDPEVISLAAATRGLIEKDIVLDMDQSLQMIFRAGFSTAAEVSSLSGRGVGLDVVEHSLAELGGSVSVRSWPGKGSEFELRLPKDLPKS